MQSLQKVKALVFDAYGTLFDVFSLGKRLSEHFPQQASSINPIWRKKQLEYTWLRTMMGRYVPFSQITEEALRFACKQVNVSLSEEIHQDLMQYYFSLDAFPEVPDIFIQLKSTYQLAILSNANREMLDQAAAHNKISQHLSAIFSVDDIGIYKPQPEVYQMLVDSFGFAKEEIAFVSSNTWDVAGAKSFGLKVIWLNRSAGQMEELGITPDLTISHLKELLDS